MRLHVSLEDYAQEESPERTETQIIENQNITEVSINVDTRIKEQCRVN